MSKPRPSMPTAQAIAEVAQHLTIGTMSAEQASRTLQAYVSAIDDIERQLLQTKENAQAAFETACVHQRAVERLRNSIKP